MRDIDTLSESERERNRETKTLIRGKEAETGRDISKQRDAGRNRELKTNIVQNGIRYCIYFCFPSV